MIIQLERSGGFTGIPLRSSIDTSQLDPQEQKNLSEMVESAHFFDLPAKIPPDNIGADRFNYKLTIEAPGQSHTVEFNEANAPVNLTLLVNRVTLLARAHK